MAIVIIKDKSVPLHENAKDEIWNRNLSVLIGPKRPSLVNKYTHECYLLDQ